MIYTFFKESGQLIIAPWGNNSLFKSVNGFHFNFMLFKDWFSLSEIYLGV